MFTFAFVIFFALFHSGIFSTIAVVQALHLKLISNQIYLLTIHLNLFNHVSFLFKTSLWSCKRSFRREKILNGVSCVNPSPFDHLIALYWNTFIAFYCVLFNDVSCLSTANNCDDHLIAHYWNTFIAFYCVLFNDVYLCSPLLLLFFLPYSIVVYFLLLL